MGVNLPTIFLVVQQVSGKLLSNAHKIMSCFFLCVLCGLCATQLSNYLKPDNLIQRHFIVLITYRVKLKS
jgi:hypothetical protein